MFRETKECIKCECVSIKRVNPDHTTNPNNKI